MKSMHGYGRNAGNIKMNGKKYMLMSCGCCVCSDFRDKYNVELMMKEIESYCALDSDEHVYNLWEDHKN